MQWILSVFARSGDHQYGGRAFIRVGSGVLVDRPSRLVKGLFPGFDRPEAIRAYPLRRNLSFPPPRP